VGLSRIARSDLLDCSARVRLVGKCNGPRRIAYARCMGRSVDEGDGLLNVETSRATALAPRGRYCFCLRRSPIALPIAGWLDPEPKLARPYGPHVLFA
jgi:hypothetical protein